MIKKIVLSILIVASSYGAFYLVSDAKQLTASILVTIAGVCIPFWFDTASDILDRIKTLNKILDTTRYQKIFDIYNNRLYNFTCNFYFFLAEILTEEKHQKLFSSAHNTDSLENLCKAFEQLLQDGQPDFARVYENGKQTFNDESWRYFNLAQGELCDISRILQSLPTILEFTAERYPPFINLQSAFYQVKNTLIHNASSRACEAFVEAFLKDLIKFISIK